MKREKRRSKGEADRHVVVWTFFIKRGGLIFAWRLKRKWEILGLFCLFAFYTFISFIFS